MKTNADQSANAGGLGASSWFFVVTNWHRLFHDLLLSWNDGRGKPDFSQPTHGTRNEGHRLDPARIELRRLRVRSHARAADPAREEKAGATPPVYRSDFAHIARHSSQPAY
jgi:hypothetical protein